MNDFTFHIAPYIDSFTNYLLLEFGGFLAVIADLLLWFQTSINDLLLVPSTWVFILAFVVISVAIGGWRLAAGGLRWSHLYRLAILPLPGYGAKRCLPLPPFRQQPSFRLGWASPSVFSWRNRRP